MSVTESPIVTFVSEVQFLKALDPIDVMLIPMYTLIGFFIHEYELSSKAMLSSAKFCLERVPDQVYFSYVPSENNILVFNDFIVNDVVIILLMLIIGLSSFTYGRVVAPGCIGSSETQF